MGLEALVRLGIAGEIKEAVIPTDPERDAATRINDLLQRLGAAGGGELVLPAGTYWLARTVVVPASCAIRGEGAGTVLKAVAALNADLVRNEAGAGGVRISDLVVDGNRAGQTGGNGIHLVNCPDAMVAVTIQNCYETGILLEGCQRPVLQATSSGNGTHGALLRGSSFASGSLVARDNGQVTAGSGLALDDDGAGNGSTDATIILAATDTRADPEKTQQYGVLEVSGSHCDRNTIIGSLSGNGYGTASLVGSQSAVVGGIALTTMTIDGGSATSAVTAVVDGGTATSVSTSTLDGGAASG